MIKHRYANGILVVNVFSSKPSIEFLCQEILHLMDDDNYTARIVMVNFHHQFHWTDYYDFLAERDQSITRIHSIGIIVEDEDKSDLIQWRAGLLRGLGIDARVFRNIAEMAGWAKSKLPDNYFTKSMV